jgi:hypothetical protein
MNLFKNLNEVFDHAKCVFCNDPLKINVDAVTGYFKKEGSDLLSIDEQDGTLLFSVDVRSNKTNFSNAEIKNRLEVFVLELQCSKHDYRHIYSLYFNKSNYDVVVNKILLDEESVLLSGLEKTYWVRNLFAEKEEPFSEISSWDSLDGTPPKSHFDLDVMDDLFATFKLETKWLKINPSMENFQERIENLITFG